MNCPIDAHAYVIFGATGNLATIKLLPALYQLHCLGYLGPNVKILGCGRSAHEAGEWREKVRATLVETGVGVDKRLEDFVSIICRAVCTRMTFTGNWRPGSVTELAPAT
jgi:glucose-6-phosphate 1-dehydrogenase